MKTISAIVTSVVIILAAFAQGCNDSKSPAPHSATPSAVMPTAGAKIVANNFSDEDWKAGVMTKNGSKNMFYFLNDARTVNPVTVGTKLVFAKSGAASVTKVDVATQGGRIAVYVTVDHDLDPAGDGFPNPILVQ